MTYTFELKYKEIGGYYVELETEIRYGRQVYRAAMHKTYDGGCTYRTIKESTTPKKQNAMATYRRYVKQATNEVNG